MTTDPTTTTTETTTKPRRAKPRHAVKAPPKLTLEAARHFAAQKARAKKGNAAMFKFISEQLGDLDAVQKMLLNGVGRVVMESVETRLNALHDSITG